MAGRFCFHLCLVGLRLDLLGLIYLGEMREACLSILQVQVLTRCLEPTSLRFCNSLQAVTSRESNCQRVWVVRSFYRRAYINSNDVGEILAGQRQALAGIDVLRKICNHPDLLQRTTTQATQDYGSPKR